MVWLLRQRTNVHSACFRAGTLSWTLQKDGWLTVVWVCLRTYSGFTDVIRFTTMAEPRIARSIWPYPKPEQYGFELTAMANELANQKLLLEVIAYCEGARLHPDRRPVAASPSFSVGGNPRANGWTNAADRTVRERLLRKR